MARRSTPETRRAIQDSAAALFAAHGYAGVSVRDIAAGASTDPALVIRHFGSKEQLFLDTMRLELEQSALLDGPLETLGVRFIEYVLEADEHIRGVFLALLRASSAEPIGSQLRRAHEENFVAPLRARLSGADADLRAREAAALVGGLLYALWIVGDETLAAAPRAEVARRYGGILQQLLTPPD